MKKSFYKYFIPNTDNDYKPHFFRERGVAILVSIIVFVFIFSLAQYLVIKEVNLASIISSVLVDFTNHDRQENNVPTMTMSSVLTKAAQMKADDMAAKGYFAHTSPDGLSPWYWFQKAGYDFSYAGENLAINFSDAGDVEKAWMNSQTHRENILNPHFTEIGIAIAKGVYNGKETIFVVQMFGRPVPASQLAVVVAPKEEKLETVTTTGDTFIAVKNSSYEEPVVAQKENAVAVKGVSYASLMEELAVSPKTTLSYSYTFIGIIISFMLGILIFVKVKVQRPLSIFYAIFLLAFMASLLYLDHTHLLPNVLIR